MHLSNSVSRSSAVSSTARVTSAPTTMKSSRRRIHHRAELRAAARLAIVWRPDPMAIFERSGFVHRRAGCFYTQPWLISQSERIIRHAGRPTGLRARVKDAHLIQRMYLFPKEPATEFSHSREESRVATKRNLTTSTHAERPARPYL